MCDFRVYLIHPHERNLPRSGNRVPMPLKNAQERTWCLDLKPFLVKNRVWFNGHVGLRDFWGKF